MIPIDISSDEEVGRRISQSGKMRGAGGRWRIFMDGHKHISIDRISVVEIEEAIEIAQKEATNLGIKFYGWLVMRVVDVLKDGRELDYTPTPTNIIHADIILPPSCDKKEHAQKLADYKDNKILSAHEEAAQPVKDEQD